VETGHACWKRGKPVKMPPGQPTQGEPRNFQGNLLGKKPKGIWLLKALGKPKILPWKLGLTKSGFGTLIMGKFLE